MCLQRRLLPVQHELQERLPKAESQERLPMPEPREQLPMPEPREQRPVELEAGRPWDFLHCVVCLHNCGKEATLGLNPLGAKQ